MALADGDSKHLDCCAPRFKEAREINARRPMTVREAADYLRVSPNTVRNLCHRNLIRYSKSLRKWLLDAEDVEKFVERTC